MANIDCGYSTGNTMAGGGGSNGNGGNGNAVVTTVNDTVNGGNNSSSQSAIQKINSYLHNTLDMRQLAALASAPQHNNSNSIDSMWSDLVSGNTDANQRSLARNKAHSVSNGTANGAALGLQSLHLNQLLNGAPANKYYQQRYQSRNNQMSNGSPNPNGNIFNYQVPVVRKDDSAGSSVGGMGGSSPPSASITSPTSPFSYSSPPKTTRLSNMSDPGSPSLDDAIMMGMQRQQQQHQQQQQQHHHHHQLNQHHTPEMNGGNEGVTLADLMGSLNISNSSTSRSTSCGGQYGSMNSVPPPVTNLNSSLNANYNNFNLQHGVDLTQLAHLQQQGSGGCWRSAQGRPFDQSFSGSMSSNSYSASNNQGINGTLLSSSGSTGVGNNTLANTASTLDMLAALERGAPLATFLSPSDPYSIEKAAKMHRTAAAVCEATCTWSGQLPVRVHKNPFYSCKVFLGGVPWDVTETALRQTFVHFGNIQVEWPGKENSANPPKGYVYILFDNEKQVKNLLSACSQDFSNGGNYYFKISSRRMRQKEVQVIPWVMSDSNYVRCPSYQLDAHKTVFIGALHGMLSAEALANIINDLFGGVVYAGIDTDKHKYPIGSGRITFNNLQSYRKAVRAAFVEIKTPKFTKKVQIDPYLADSLCQVCGMQQGPYFCRDESCFKYFCRTCWLVTPNHQSGAGCHKPLMRNSKLRTQTRLTGVL